MLVMKYLRSIYRILRLITSKSDLIFLWIPLWYHCKTNHLKLLIF